MRRTFIPILLLAFALPTFADEGREKAIQAATVLVDQGKVDEAIVALKKLVADDPSDPSALYELGLAYSSKGDHANCRATLEPLAETKSALRPLIVGMLGTCLDELEERAKAIETYRRGLESYPDNSGLLFNLAISLAQGGKLDEARELLKHDVEKNPWHASAHFVLAQILQTQHFYIPAALTYLRFLALEPASSRTSVAAKHLMEVLNRGVTPTKGGVNITISTNDPKDEGDYGPLQMTLSILAGGSAKADKKTSEFEAARSQIQSFLAIVSEEKEQRSDFTARVQIPFFASLEQAKLADIFAGIALGSLKLNGDREWVTKNEKEIGRYFNWLDPQLRRPAVVIR